MSNDFHSLLSVFQAATSAPSGGGGNNGRPPQRPAAAGRTSLGAPGDAASHPPASGGDDVPAIDPASATDPSFAPSLLKGRIERAMRIRQIRRSAAAGGGNAQDGSKREKDARNEVRIAVCATIVDEFPHEAVWRKWMEGTGGEFSVRGDAAAAADDGTASKGEVDGSNEGEASRKLTSSAELYVHAKNPERVRSEWLRSKTIPITHRPNWNDVRIVRAILSLLAAALRDERTTHVLLCTESCVPVATLNETARSVLLDEICPWEEDGSGGVQPVKNDGKGGRRGDNRGGQRVDWDRSHLDWYGRGSGRCTRFDEHNCWGILRDSVPSEAIHKALPGWCFLSRKHAQSIVDLPSQLEGSNLWPAFERVWAPEEVFLPTALSICGHLDEVARRALTHSEWDERAANHKDRAHPLSYDGNFDDRLVSRVRRDGCLFLRKMKRPLDADMWEKIVVHHQRGHDSGASMEESRYHGNEGRDNRSYGSRSGYDSGRRHHDDRQRHKRGRGDYSGRDGSKKRHRW